LFCLPVLVQKLNRQGAFAERGGYSLGGLVPPARTKPAQGLWLTHATLHGSCTI